MSKARSLTASSFNGAFDCLSSLEAGSRQLVRKTLHLWLHLPHWRIRMLAAIRQDHAVVVLLVLAMLQQVLLPADGGLHLIRLLGSANLGLQLPEPSLRN